MLKKYLLIVSTFILIFGGVAILRQNSRQKPVFAEGGIEIVASSPLFNFTNMYPGQEVVGRVTVKSTSVIPQNVGLRLTLVNIFDLMTAGKFFLKVKDVASDTIIFGNPGGIKFSSLTLTPRESFLFTINPGETKVLDLIVLLDPKTINYFQGKGITFDFSLGFIASNRLSRFRF